MEEKSYWLALTMVQRLGPVRIKKLVDYFGSAKQVWQANALDLRASGCLDRSSFEQLLAAQKTVQPEAEWLHVEKKKMQVITLYDVDYPENLRSLYDPPPVLYVQGQLWREDSTSLAIVGARQASFYGLGVAERLSGELAAEQITIVSGLARGIDTAAHKGALRAEGRTIAVLGCGLDRIYPPENGRLYAEIREKGALLSEFPPGTPPNKIHFPRRNRLISGLSLGVLIVEAAEKSGSLITADFALEQGREVFAVPGMITSKQSRGSNRLIQEGAKLVQGTADILEELGYQRKHVPEEKNISLSETERLIWAVLGDKPKGIEEILAASGCSLGVVYQVLTDLEMKQYIRKLPGNLFFIASSS